MICLSWYCCIFDNSYPFYFSIHTTGKTVMTCPCHIKFGGRGERRRTITTGSVHYSSWQFSCSTYWYTSLANRKLVMRVAKQSGSQPLKNKDSDADAEIPLWTVLGPFWSQPTIPCWDLKDSRSTSQFLTMCRVLLLLFFLWYIYLSYSCCLF